MTRSVATFMCRRSFKRRPGSLALVLFIHGTQVGVGTEHQQHAYVTITMAGDRSEPRYATWGVLFRCKPDGAA